MDVAIVSRSGKSLGTFSLATDSTLKDLKKIFHSKHRKYYPERQYFTIGAGKEKTALKNDKSKLKDLGVQNGTKLVFKDLGPQVAWRTVFLAEYFGPILIHALVYFLPQLVYRVDFEKSHVQRVALGLVLLHYLKREFETVFIHRFGNETMPVFNIFKNSFHYWILGGANIAYFLYHPKFTQHRSNLEVNICAVAIILCILGNFWTHIILRNLRPAGSNVRKIPRGFLFEYVSCPNYSLEILEWIIFAYMTQTLTAWIFTIIASGQMWIWAVQKHKRYRKEFDGKQGRDKYPYRKVLIPFIL